MSGILAIPGLVHALSVYCDYHYIALDWVEKDEGLLRTEYGVAGDR